MRVAATPAKAEAGWPQRSTKALTDTAGQARKSAVLGRRWLRRTVGATSHRSIRATGCHIK